MTVTINEAAQHDLEALEQSHYRCDETNDEECAAEQYGDGDASQHAYMRELRAALTSDDDTEPFDFAALRDDLTTVADELSSQHFDQADRMLTRIINELPR